jgi:signal transduction histidine kinase
VSAPALADAVTHLPGLAPSAAALVALARAPASAWEQIRFDPGAVLLLAQNADLAASVATNHWGSNLPQDAAIFDAAVRLLDRAPFVDWSMSPARRLYDSALVYARLARHIADKTEHLDPDIAWIAGLLAPLGWFAVCAVASDQVSACLDDPMFRDRPTTVERRQWGTDQAAIARRLNRRLRLPRWLGAVTGHLDLPVEDALALGADPHVFRIVQLAVGLAQRETPGLQLPVGAPPSDLTAELGLSGADLDGAEAIAGGAAAADLPTLTWQAPGEVPLLRDLLVQAAENRRLADGPALHELEIEVDHLHRALSEQRSGEENRLRDQKLTSLAEFAAGAGHEINNPLAVISGQAQYLLGDEADSARQRSLQTIINQTTCPITRSNRWLTLGKYIWHWNAWCEMPSKPPRPKGGPACVWIRRRRIGLT